MAITIEVTKLKENKLLSRTELNITVNHPKEGIPKKETIVEKIAATQKASPKNVIVYNLTGRYGTHASKGKVKIYHSWEQLEKIERAFVIAKKTGVKEPKVVRRLRKDARKKKAKMFGTLKRNMKKAEKKEAK